MGILFIEELKMQNPPLAESLEQVVLLSVEQIENGIKGMSAYRTLIETNHRPYIEWETGARFDLVVQSFRAASPDSSIRRRISWPYVKNLHAQVRGYFMMQHVEESTQVLRDLYRVYQQIEDGRKPKVDEEKIEKFGSALSRLKKLIEWNAAEKQVLPAIPHLERAYAKIIAYSMN
jgi:hypothetical protein